MFATYLAQSRATRAVLRETKRSGHLRLRLPNAYNVRPEGRTKYTGFLTIFGLIPSQAK